MRLRYLFGLYLLKQAGIEGIVALVAVLAVFSIPLALAAAGVSAAKGWVFWSKTESTLGESLLIGLLVLVSPFYLGVEMMITAGILQNFKILALWSAGLEGPAYVGAVAAGLVILSLPLVLSLAVVTARKGRAFWREPRDYSPPQNRLIRFLCLISPIPVGLVLVVFSLFVG